MCDVQPLRAFVQQRLSAAAEDIIQEFERMIAKYEHQLRERHKLLDAVVGPQVHLRRADQPQPRVCETKSTMDQEDLHLKEEPAKRHGSQEGEQPVLKRDTDVVMVTPTHGENGQSEDQTLYVKAEGGAAQTEESVVSMQVVSVVGAADIHLLIPNSSQVSHDERGETSREDVEIEPQMQTQGTNNTSKKLYTCTLCSKSYTIRGSLKAHMRTHTGEKPYICETCGKAFPQTGVLKKHTRTHTGEKPYICQTCGKAFAQNEHLKSHQKIHTGEKPYICKICGKHFRLKAHLDKHIRVHTGEKPYICETCGKHFNQKGTLKIHLTVHTGEKPYICKICGKHFRLKAHLDNHIRVHTGEKPYICETCGKHFSEKCALNRHMRIHSREKRTSIQHVE